MKSLLFMLKSSKVNRYLGKRIMTQTVLHKHRWVAWFMIMSRHQALRVKNVSTYRLWWKMGCRVISKISGPMRLKHTGNKINRLIAQRSYFIMFWIIISCRYVVNLNINCYRLVIEIKRIWTKMFLNKYFKAFVTINFKIYP